MSDEELNAILDAKPNVSSDDSDDCCSSPPRGISYSEDGDSEEHFAKSYCQWSTSDGRIFVPTTFTQKALTPGVYEVNTSPNIGLYLEKIAVKTEGLVRFPDSNSDLVVEEIQKFWDKEEQFKEFELVYKRGILLWGPPGSGKSCTLQLIMEDVINRNGVVIRFDDPDLFLDGMRAIRTIQIETPVVVIMEDIDSIINEYSESEVLNILDGVNEVHKAVFLATTNYPDRLGKRIVNRPSRFDKRFKIGMPNAESRAVYLKHLCRKHEPNALGIDLDKWVADTKEFSIAHLKELFVAVVILGDDYSKAIKTLKNMKEDINDQDYKIGFNRDDDDDYEG